MKEPARMTNAEINKYHGRVGDYLSKNADRWIELGLGRLRGSEIRRIPELDVKNVRGILAAFADDNVIIEDIRGLRKRGLKRAIRYDGPASELVRAGLGHLRISELAEKWDEIRELAERYAALSDQAAALSHEIRLRMGPNWFGELPKGGAREKAA